MLSRFKIQSPELVALCGICSILLGLNGALLLLHGNHTTTSADAAGVIPRSVAAGPIGSGCVDPNMTHAEERKIRDILNTSDETSWAGWQVNDLVAYVNEKTPAYLDCSELEIYGVPPSTTFAGEQIPAGRLSMRLGLALQPIELTYQLRGGCVVFTTLDAADSQPSLRVYDVAPLVNSMDTYSLIHSIVQNIEPDCWISAGGQSSISPYQTPSRCYLIVSTRSTTQMQVEAMLERLNQSEAFRFASQLQTNYTAPTRRPIQFNNAGSVLSPAVSPSQANRILGGGIGPCFSGQGY